MIKLGDTDRGLDHKMLGALKPEDSSESVPYSPQDPLYMDSAKVAGYGGKLVTDAKGPVTCML